VEFPTGGGLNAPAGFKWEVKYFMGQFVIRLGAPGIFGLMGLALIFTGHGWWALLAWVVAVIIAVAGYYFS
jgi:hypothetical protein